MAATQPSTSSQDDVAVQTPIPGETDTDVPGGDTQAPPPTVAPVFPSRPLLQQGPVLEPSFSAPLQVPPPQGLSKSPEELARDIGFEALTQAVQASAVNMYPDNPKAVATTVANALKPWLPAFGHAPVTSATHTTSSTPLSKTTESIMLNALSGTKSHEVAKYTQTFPKFPGDACRDDVDLWEQYWERVYGFARIVRCDDEFLAHMIKETADKHSSLYLTLEHLKYSDGTFAAAGFEGVRYAMEQDYAPRGHAIKMKARNTLLHHTYRKYKEKPRWFFRRVDRNLQAMSTKDEGTYVSDDFLAELYLTKCGLNRREQEEIFEKAGGKWDPDKIREAILTYYEQAHELDGARLYRSRARANGHTVNLVVHDPANNVTGTDLTPDLVEELDELAHLDTSGKTFDLQNPTFYTQKLHSCSNSDCATCQQ